MVFYIRREDVPQFSRFDMKGVVIICLCFGGGFFVECWNFSPDAMTWVLKERHVEIIWHNSLDYFPGVN